MSDRTDGVIFESDKDRAVDFFCNLEPVTFLRLVRLDAPGPWGVADALWGIAAEGWPGDREVLDEIAQEASIAFSVSLRYRYDGCVGSLSDLYEDGQRTRTQDEEDRSTPQFRNDVFTVFGRDRTMHEKAESALLWGDHQDVVLDIRWRPG